MATTVNKAIYPPPPPFYQLYTQPPPIPGSSDESGDAERSTQLPLDIYKPPPPLTEPFIKFGEVQQPGLDVQELPAEIPALYVLKRGATVKVKEEQKNDTSSASVPAAAAASTSAATPAATPSYPDLIDHVLSLRLLNRQYLQRYISLLASLVPLPGSALSPQSPTANPGEHVEACLKELSEISTNYSLLLTQLRPHQANQTLMQVVMKQIERRKKKKEKVEKCIADARSFLSAHGVEYAEGSKDILPQNQPELLAAPRQEYETHVKQEDRMDVDHSRPGDAQKRLQRDPNALLQAFLNSISE